MSNKMKAVNLTVNQEDILNSDTITMDRIKDAYRKLVDIAYLNVDIQVIGANNLEDEELKDEVFDSIARIKSHLNHSYEVINSIENLDTLLQFQATMDQHAFTNELVLFATMLGDEQITDADKRTSEKKSNIRNSNIS